MCTVRYATGDGIHTQCVGHVLFIWHKMDDHYVKFRNFFYALCLFEFEFVNI